MIKTLFLCSSLVMTCNMFGFGYNEIKEYSLQKAKDTRCNYCFWPGCKSQAKNFSFDSKISLRTHLNKHIKKLNNSSSN